MCVCVRGGVVKTRAGPGTLSLAPRHREPATVASPDTTSSLDFIKTSLLRMARGPKVLIGTTFRWLHVCYMCVCVLVVSHESVAHLLCFACYYEFVFGCLGLSVGKRWLWGSSGVKLLTVLSVCLSVCGFASSTLSRSEQPRKRREREQPLQWTVKSFLLF